MFLKRLDLQGFKTFAAKTEFVFDTGITAIVGPNGSGKSNIADAVRWVLGEQSARPLRIKRLDDVIFAGSSARPRVGMAEVSITLDNSTKWLPVEFSEVTFTRRAYRSGESEYLINKSRVRLRDVVDMLLAGNVGQNNYTVIGQGAIDAALSLRPEERRTLFEEAADIKRYQIKRNEALAKLQTTDGNLVRVRDLMAEIAPRLQTLQVQAQRAQEQERLVQELRGYLAAWYAHRWNEASDGLRRAIAAESEAQRAAVEAEAALSRTTADLSAVRQREAELRTQLSAWHRESSALHGQAEALERRMAVGRASLDATARQRQELLDEVGPLQEQLSAQEQTAGASQDNLTALIAAQGRRRDTLAALEQEAAALDGQRRQAQKKLEATEAGIVRLVSAIAAADSTLGSLGGRRQALLSDVQRRQAQAAAHLSSLAGVEQVIADLRAALGKQDADTARQSGERPAAQAAIAAARQEHEAAMAAQTTAREERRTLELRLETLSRLHESLTGYDAGVRSVLNAARSQTLKNVVGTVASLVRVPAQYEAAIGAALGSHEQDIVTETWQAAEAAVEHLRQTRSGRATFLPLDVIRPRQATEKVSDAIGWAADLVEAADPYRTVVSYLLGRVLIVRDLSTARRVLNLPATRSVASIVTLAGDIVRPGGAITGGSPTVRSSGLLERERELADLPRRIETARAHERTREQTLAAALAALRQAEEHLVSLDGRLAAARRTRDEQTSGIAQRQREMERWQQEAAWERDQERSLQRTLAGLDAQEQKLTADLATQRRQQADAQALAEALRQEIATMAGSALAARLAEARTAAALGEQEVKSSASVLASQRQSVERMAAQIATKTQRANELAKEIEQVRLDIEEARRVARQVSAAIASLQERITPAETEIEGMEKQRTALLESETRARASVATLERARSQAAIDVQRARSELGKLQSQIEAEEGLTVQGFGLDEDEVSRLLEEMAVPVQLSLTPTSAGDAPSPVAAPEFLKRRVDSLRGQLRHLGAVNPNAVAEYEETLKRYTFLATQSEDLDKAVKSLKTVIGELDDLMRKRFEITFDAVAREFRRYFTTLFGGGTARLSLTDPDDLAETGIEIVAQPPGKRLQNLALLSGGERALTATALLFAIITVNPTPFCVLDEVDAALDDANVGRFTQALRTLAQHTQFIVITHNKGTMEIASSLYGVSMAADSTSQVLSLKLEDIPAG
jgi:chromosome segregation protein